jgi:DNA polymerase-3 subunit delta
MLPDQFVASLQRQAPAAVYLFVGPEGFRRGACRRALIEKVLPEEEREEGFVRHDLDELSLSEVLDDACSMSLFAGRRLLWVSAAESALPRGRAAAAAEEEEGGGGKEGGAELLAHYCKDPTPGVVIVFDAQKWDFDGEDKAKMDRLRKFYGGIQAVVEFPRFSPADARGFAQKLATEKRLNIGAAEIDLLVEATGADASRLASEIEKLALFAGEGMKVTAADIASLVPDAQETTIFNLVNALARRNRTQSMELLDTLVREGEYLPLALTFLGGLFRLALAAQEQGLRSANDVQSFFSRQGIAMWRSRAEQIYTASARFSPEKLKEGLQLVFRADKDLKSSRVDDRIVMEEFVLHLTK